MSGLSPKGLGKRLPSDYRVGLNPLCQGFLQKDITISGIDRWYISLNPLCQGFLQKDVTSLP